MEEHEKSDTTATVVITIAAPADQIGDYLAHVVQQYRQGHTSGHRDAATRWDSRQQLVHRTADIATSIGGGPGIKMITLSVGWTETSRHSTKIRVPATSQVEDLDLENMLATLDHDGLESLQRQIDWVQPVPDGDDDAMR